MRTTLKASRQTVSLPVRLASEVRMMARKRHLSANRVIVELIESGIEVEKRRQRKFFELADRFRRAKDPEEVQRLGCEMGRMVFGG